MSDIKHPCARCGTEVERWPLTNMCDECARAAATSGPIKPKGDPENQADDPVFLARGGLTRPSGNAPRWRVDYHLWAAGGRLVAHSTEVRALTEADAIADAERLERAHAARAGLSHSGYFKDATAERLEGGS